MLLTKVAGLDEVGWREPFAVLPCCSFAAARCCSLSQTAPEVPGVSELLSRQPRNGEAIPMSRITTITFILAALGMATPSVLYHLPDASESLPSWKREWAKERPDSPPCYFHSWPDSPSNVPLSKR